MIQRLLIANRGEIACRIIQTARRMGVFTIAVFSEADRGARHVALADASVLIGPSEASESYLRADALLSAAARTDADAIHPGYGFLSENADFARSVVDAGLTWVGPPASAIDAMGDKARSKVLMRQAGVPCVPGFDADDPTDAELVAAGAQVGLPLLVKASAGGGGRGMRRVETLDALPDAIRSARAEAQGAFGSSMLLLERLVEGARHVEVQVMADTFGAIIHLGERDCSV
ncbi:MAG: biotin carboxylase N-terminal domain-containing protein, partial [Myxococcota bacterium]